MSLPPGSQAALSHPSQRERVLKGEWGGLRGTVGTMKGEVSSFGGRRWPFPWRMQVENWCPGAA